MYIFNFNKNLKLIGLKIKDLTRVKKRIEEKKVLGSKVVKE